MIDPIGESFANPLLGFRDYYPIRMRRLRPPPSAPARSAPEDTITLSRAARRIMDQERRLAAMRIGRNEEEGPA